MILNFSIGNLLRKIEADGTKTLKKILKRNLAINTFMKIVHFLSSLQMLFRDWYVYICLHQKKKKKIEWASSLVLKIYMLSYNRHFLVIQMLLLIPAPPPEGIRMNLQCVKTTKYPWLGLKKKLLTQRKFINHQL